MYVRNDLVLVLLLGEGNRFCHALEQVHNRRAAQLEIRGIHIHPR
jgi:hypothetical protein